MDLFDAIFFRIVIRDMSSYSSKNSIGVYEMPVKRVYYTHSCWRRKANLSKLLQKDRPPAERYLANLYIIARLLGDLLHLRNVL